MLRSVDKLICVSDEARCSFQKAGVPAGKLEIVRNGIVPRRVCADRQTIRVRLNLPLDVRIPYDLSFEDTVDYLARKIPNYSIVVACQGVRDVYCAYEKLAEKCADCPPLHQHGGTVEEATNNQKNFYRPLRRGVPFHSPPRRPRNARTPAARRRNSLNG